MMEDFEKNFVPLDDRMLVRLDVSPDKIGSIILPANAQEKYPTGVVISSGPGIHLDGQWIAMDIKAGDRVLFGQFAGINVPGDDMLKVVSRRDVVGRIKQ